MYFIVGFFVSLIAVGICGFLSAKGLLWDLNYKYDFEKPLPHEVLIMPCALCIVAWPLAIVLGAFFSVCATYYYVFKGMNHLAKPKNKVDNQTGK
jgi:hypothetical protein